MLPKRALGLGLLIVVLTATVASGASVFKRGSNETNIDLDEESEKGDGEGVVESYLLAKEDAVIEIEEFLANADPGAKPDMETEVMQTLRYWREKLKEENLPAEDLAAVLMGDPGLEDADSSDDASSTGTSVSKRTIEAYIKRRWPGGLVPYVLTDELSDHQKNEILRSMETFHRFTCIRYMPWENKNGTTTNNELGLDHPSYLKFVNGGGCWSYQGNIHRASGQAISCCGGTTCMHEIGHAMGLLHEHQSPHSDRNRYIRINPHYIAGNGQGWYSQKTRGFLSNGFDLSSYMHYASWMFGNGKGPTFTILFPELRGHNSYYYMLREISIAHKCQDQCSGAGLTCENDGFLTKVDGKCACQCIRGLDPATGCTTIYKQDAEGLEFPGGNYAIPAHSSGCPDDSFTSGSRTHYNDGGNQKHGDYDLKGSVTDKMVEENFCVKSSAENDVVWPGSNLCLYRTGGSCPEGFSQGFIQFDDNAAEGQTNAKSGDLPDGVFGDDTRFEYCCRDMGFSFDELLLPSRKPFSLIKHPRQRCQQVKGMHSREFFVKYNNVEVDDATSAEAGGNNPVRRVYKNTNTYQVDYCSYIPAVIDCGDIIELDASNPEVSFSSINQPELECYWLIKAPKGQRLSLDFTDFDIKGVPGRCEDDLEVRYVRPGQPGLRYCGRQWEKTTISINNTLHIRLSTYGASDSHFSATVKLIQDEDLCYAASDMGMTYAGDISFTRDFEPCLPWHEMAHCEANPYRTNIFNAVLEGNKCRNPDQGTGFQPWCYTGKEKCVRNYCDVCLIGKLYDDRADCAALQASGNCPMTGCAKTCIGELSKPAKVSQISCPAPGDAPDGALVDEAKSSYSVGESVTYKCNYHESIKERLCLSSGEWSPMGAVCSGCPPGWHANMDFGLCYKVFPDRLKYSPAKDKCSEISATLIMPKGSEQLAYVKTILEDSSWLGVTDAVEEGTWVFLDGDVANTTNWRGGQPDNWNNREHCAEMSTNGYWNDLPCYWYSRGVVCQKPTESVRDCLDFSDRCEQLFQLQPDMCTRFPEFATNECRKTCGSCDRDSTPKCTLEPAGPNSATTETRTELSRGESVTYTCNEGFDLIGGDQVRGCQASGAITGSLLQCAKACPEGWAFYSGNRYCYKKFDIASKFPEAQAGCAAQNATLIMIKNEEEQAFVKKTLGGSNFWLGLTDTEEESVFKWIDGSPAIYTFWKRGEPNNWGWHGEDCGMFKHDGTWNDGHCTYYRYGYACMKPMQE